MPFQKEIAYPEDKAVQFHFIDVGQGDCTLITGMDKNILIDTGSAEYGSIVYEYLRSLGIRSLDAFIGTHPHEDHLGGAAAILSRIKVKNVYLNGESSNSYFFERFVDILLEKDITPLIPDLDCVYDFSPFKLRFLSPGKDFENTNDNSLVLKVEYGGVSALFTGDAERSVEAELIKNKKDINADILKVSHHGSRYASSAEFLGKVSPSVSVVQSGTGNSYGHPHKEALERLEKYSEKVLRCDQNGTVVILADEENIYSASGEVYVKNERNEANDLIYIGNKKSRIYHSEVCPNLPGDKNRVIFKTREAASLSGYSACGNCNP